MKNKKKKLKTKKKNIRQKRMTQIADVFPDIPPPKNMVR